MADGCRAHYRRAMRTRSVVSFVLAVTLAALATGCRGKLDRSSTDRALTPVADAAFGSAIGLRGSIVIGATFSGGIPLAGASIALAGASGDTLRARSDVGGRFEIGAIPAGAYEMEVVVPRDTGSVRRRVTVGIQPVRVVIPSGTGRVDVQLLARYLPGSTRIIAAVDLVTADR